MFVKVHGNRDYVKGNAQSCKDLVAYLAKENEGKSLVEKEFFFNQHAESITDSFVTQVIDSKTKSLKKSDARFFMITISPSQAELGHLARLSSGREIHSIDLLKPQELERYNRYIKEYVNEAMHSYAKCFNRGVERDNLHYFAKIEQQRNYKGFDPEVRQGLVKAGEVKPGLQTHGHVIISRLDTEQKMSLSPLANSRGHSSKHKLNGNNVKVGFDRKQFKKDCEEQFDRQFSFKREYNQRFDYYNSKGYEKAVHAFKNHLAYKYVMKGLRPRPTELETAAVQILKTYNLINKVPSVQTFVREGLKLLGKAASIGIEI